MRNVTCTQCGKEIQVPSDLKEFSCVYCGTRMKAQQPSADGTEGKSYYQTHCLDLIKNHLGIDKLVTAKEYAPAFTEYMEKNKEIFTQLDAAVQGGVYTAREAAADFLDALERYWDTDTSRKQRKGMKTETDKFVIAVFLVPMVQELKLPVSGPFCEQLQQQWCSRHPKSPFYLGTFEEMNKGFEKKILGLCFITTAICRQEGKADDCEELTAFRSFRDGYLRSCPDGAELIEEYYNIAPGILLHIDLSQDRERIYRDLRKTYLQPCYEDILAGRTGQCKARYIEMVRTLERKYLS